MSDLNNYNTLDKTKTDLIANIPHLILIELSRMILDKPDAGWDDLKNFCVLNTRNRDFCQSNVLWNYILANYPQILMNLNSNQLYALCQKDNSLRRVCGNTFWAKKPMKREIICKVWRK